MKTPASSCEAASPSTREFVHQSLRSCLLNTTLRGPRRIVTSEYRYLSYFWTVVCGGSLLLLTVHFYQLVQTYLAYQTYMLQTDMTQTNAAKFPTEFPDIVICPHQIFSTAALQLWINNTVNSPWKVIRDYKTRTNRHTDKLLKFSETDLRILLDSFNYPATLGYYLNSLTDEEVLKLGRGTDMLIDCSVATNGRRGLGTTVQSS